MNNIRQKNVILGMRHSNEIPYGNSEYVNQYLECQHITYADVNNAMRQLLDNDLFIESELNQTSSYMVGPKSRDGIPDGPNGYKAYGDIDRSETFDILHKVNKALSATIRRVSGGDVAFVTVFSDVVFVGCPDGLRYSMDYSLSSMKSIQITATNFYQDDDMLVFSASDGVYMLSAWYDEDEDSITYGERLYDVARLNSNTLTGLKSVYLDRTNRTIFAGGEDAVYSGAFDLGSSVEDLAGSIEFETQQMFDSYGKRVRTPVVAAGSDGMTTVVGTSAGMFQPNSATVFRDRLDIYQRSGGQAVPKTCTAMAVFDGKTYVAAENGLFVVSGEDLVRPSLTGGDITQEVVDIMASGDTMYVATRHAVYSVTREMVRSADYLQSAIPENRIPSSAEVRKILPADGTLFVATDSGLYCFNASGTPYIREVLRSGETVALPRSASGSRFEDITDICKIGSTLVVGTGSGVFRLDVSSSEECETSVIRSLDRHVDLYGKSFSAEVKKIVVSSSSRVYVVASGYICAADNVDEKWLAPGGSVETVNDASFATVDGQSYMLVATSMAAYLLDFSDGTLKTSAVAYGVSGQACAANDDVILVAGAGGVKYVCNDVSKFSSSSWLTIECVVDQLATDGGQIYGAKTGGGAFSFSESTALAMKNEYSSVTSYAWSSDASGYMFVKGGELKFKKFSCEYDVSSPDDDVNVSYDSDISSWYLPGSDPTGSPTAVFVDESSKCAYLGTSVNLLSATFEEISREQAERHAAAAAADKDLADEKITQEEHDNQIDAIWTGTDGKIQKAFVKCECSVPPGRVNCICRGYTGESAAGPAYCHGSYTAIQGSVIKDVEVSENESILVATGNGLFELKAGGSQFVQVRTTVYKAIDMEPGIFVGLTNDGHVHMCDVEESLEEDVKGEGIEPGTAGTTATYIKYTASSDLSKVCQSTNHDGSWNTVNVDASGDSYTVYLAGGMIVVMMSVSNGDISDASFSFSTSDYCKCADTTASICQILPFGDRPRMVYYIGEQTEYDEYERDDGEIKTRTLTRYVEYSYDPTEALLGISYSDMIIFVSNGMYVIDGANVAVTATQLTSVSGVRHMRDVAGSLLFICSAGVRSSDGGIPWPSLVVDDLQYADGNCYVKTSAGWTYVAYQQFQISPSTALESATSLATALSEAGLPAADLEFRQAVDGVYVGSSSGLFKIDYFTYEVKTYQTAALPSPLDSACAYSLNPSTKSAKAAVVIRTADGRFKIYDYSVKTGTAVLMQYFADSSYRNIVSEFSGVAFADGNSNDILYVVDSDGNLYQVESRLMKTAPLVDETFFDIRRVIRSGGIMISRNGCVMSFSSLSPGVTWKPLADVGQVRQMHDVVGKCLIATSSGLWYYDEVRHAVESVDDATGKTKTEYAYEGECVQLRAADEGIDCMFQYSNDGKAVYMYASGDSMLSSANYKMWKPVLEWKVLNDGRETGITRSNGLYKLDDRTYFLAATNGLFMTKQQYETVHDVGEFTKDDALGVYNGLFQSVISASVSAAISNHVSSTAGDHSDSSIISRINRDYLNVDFNNVAGDWSSLTLSNSNAGYIDVRNDIVGEMLFGNFMDGEVFAYASSYVMASGPAQLDNISYIMKRWTSGVTELYVNVPTTSSYYLANCYGASNCRHDQSDAYRRKNLEQFGAATSIQDSTLSTHWTSLSVCIASASYHVDNLLDVQVNGMSPPLAVYKDQSSTGDTGIAGSMYRSFIEPSVVRKWDVSNTDEDGNYVFEFACFGTDAQAVKIMFYDEKSRTASDCVKIVFDANGGEGKMPNQKFVITRDSAGRTILEQKNLRKCLFTNNSSGHSKIFAGWSTLPLADNSTAAYDDKSSFPLYASGQTFADLMSELGDPARADDLRRNEEIRLYAVWLDYQFSDTDTTLLMQSDRSEFYIDSVGIDPSTRLKDKVVISFGD